MFELLLGTMLFAIVLLAAYGVYRNDVRRQEEAWRQSGDSRLEMRTKSRERAALAKALNARDNVDFLATRACPECGEVVGAARARSAEDWRVSFVAEAHRMHPALLMTAFFEHGPIPLRCAVCGALVALDHWSPELRRLSEAEADIFLSQFPH